MLMLTSFSKTYQFQHTAARRRLEKVIFHTNSVIQFQHTAARRRLADSLPKLVGIGMFQHTAARRRLGVFIDWLSITFHVSTHSRPKAAGSILS